MRRVWGSEERREAVFNAFTPEFWPTTSKAVTVVPEYERMKHKLQAVMSRILFQLSYLYLLRFFIALNAIERH